jgi:hypothetical protein
MIDAGGGLHPRVALMLDVESGGNPAGDGSSWIDDLYWNLADYPGSSARIIGYANAFDFSNMCVRVPPACASSGPAMGRIRIFPGKWPTNTPTALVTAPICRRALPYSATAT